MKGVTIVNTFQIILNNSGSKPNKIRFDQSSEFYNKSFETWLDDNDIKMYSIHNQRKSVVTERFIQTLEHKIYKYMTAVSKNVYFDVLVDIFDKCNNAYHRTGRMKPNDIKSASYAKYSVDFDAKYANFKIGDVFAVKN